MIPVRAITEREVQRGIGKTRRFDVHCISRAQTVGVCRQVIMNNGSPQAGDAVALAIFVEGS